MGKQYGILARAVSGYAQTAPDRRAVIDRRGVHTYRDLWQDICACALALEELGLKKHDRVVMECTQDEFFLAMNFACQLTGSLFVGVERRVAPDRLDEIISQTKPALVLTLKPAGAKLSGTGNAPSMAPGAHVQCSEAHREPVYIDVKGFASLLEKQRESDLDVMPDQAAVMLEQADPEDTAEILFSTGTTGKSKGVVLSNRANVANAENIIAGTHMDKDSVEAVPLPVNHAHGLRTCYAHLLHGSTVIIAGGITLPRVLFDMMERYGADAMDLTPSAAQMLMKSSSEKLRGIAPRIKYIEIGAAFLPESTKQQLRKFFPDSRLYNFYGSSESGRTCCLDFSTDTDLPGCIGKPVPNAHFEIMDPDGNPMDSDAEHTGLLATAGPMNMTCYWGEPELTSETLRNGYLITSDLSYIDENGYIYVLGRADDVINYKGVKISPEEIEEVAIQSPMVSDCACVPVEDELAGQVPELYVVAADDCDFSEAGLLKFLRNRVDDNRMPRSVKLIDKIPRTYNGKILRRELAGRSAGQHTI